MAEQLTLEKALELVSFTKDSFGKWRVGIVRGDVHGSVHGNVCSDVRGDVGGNVCGDVGGNVGGNVEGSVHGDVYGDVFGNVRSNVLGSVGGSVWSTISDKKWAYIETPREKLARLIKESGNVELVEAFNELEDSND